MRIFLIRFKPVVYLVLFFASWQFLQLYNFTYAFQEGTADEIRRQKIRDKIKNNSFETKKGGRFYLLRCHEQHA